MFNSYLINLMRVYCTYIGRKKKTKKKGFRWLEIKMKVHLLIKKYEEIVDTFLLLYRGALFTVIISGHRPQV